MNLHIQRYLRNGGSIEGLKEQWGITATPSVKYPELVLFKYNQIESPMAAPIVQECRGIILNSKDNWAVVCRSFDKFFNIEEPLAAPIDWENCRVQEKLDGSLMQMYWYNDQWNVATSGNPDAAGNVNGFDMTFETLFWDTFRALGLDRFHYPKTFTVVWELTSPYNKVVVQHKEPKLTLIGLRSITSGYEWTVAKAAELGIIIPIMGQTVENLPIVKEFPLTCMADVLAACKGLRGFEQEGFVVVDCDFHRVKVKSPEYVMLHHTRDSMSPKGFVDVIRKGESDEFLSYFPEFTDLFNTIKRKYQFFVAGCDADWYTVMDGANEHGISRKEFAEMAKTKRLPGYLFARWDSKVANCAEYLKNLPIDTVMRLLELK